MLLVPDFEADSDIKSAAQKLSRHLDPAYVTLSLSSGDVKACRDFCESLKRNNVSAKERLSALQGVAFLYPNEPYFLDEIILIYQESERQEEAEVYKLWKRQLAEKGSYREALRGALRQHAEDEIALAERVADRMSRVKRTDPRELERSSNEIRAAIERGDSVPSVLSLINKLSLLSL